VHAVVIYESLTGNTRKAATLITSELIAQDVDAVACPVDHIDYQALSQADIVIVGAWTDGLIFVGQRPGRAHRLRAMPVMDGKRALVFCTYAIDPGKVLEKLTAIVESRGADVLGGMALRRDRLQEGARQFVSRLLEAVQA
jgi:hypothetical protein